MKDLIIFAAGTLIGCLVALYGMVPKWIRDGRKRRCRVLERDHRDSVKKTKYREFGNFLADFAIGVLNENDKSDFRDVKEMADYIFEKTGCRIQIQDCETGRVLPLNPYQRSCEEGWGV